MNDKYKLLMSFAWGLAAVYFTACSSTEDHGVGTERTFKPYDLRVSLSLSPNEA